MIALLWRARTARGCAFFHDLAAHVINAAGGPSRERRPTSWATTKVGAVPAPRAPRREKPHTGINGKPCQCTPYGRRKASRGCARTCPCHGLRHAKCPKAHPCYGGCGRLTTAHESNSPGYCTHCAADKRWRPVFA